MFRLVRCVSTRDKNITKKLWHKLQIRKRLRTSPPANYSACAGKKTTLAVSRSRRHVRCEYSSRKPEIRNGVETIENVSPSVRKYNGNYSHPALQVITITCRVFGVAIYEMVLKWYLIRCFVN